MTREIMTLDLDFNEVDVVLKGKDGREKKYLLRELDGAKRNNYLNKMTSRVIMKDGKAVGMKSFEGFQSDLLKLSLFDEDGKPVSEEEIEGMPSRTQEKLFEKAEKISGLDKMENQQEEKEKNE